jgi:FkbM family methyltransferase
VHLLGEGHISGAVPPALRHRTSALPRPSADVVLGISRKLRPRKIRNAVRRRWFEWQLSRHRLSEAPGLLDLGSKPGGWTVPADLVDSGWCCYCVGAGGDVSFDIELMRRFGVRVRSFDPVEDYVRSARSEVGSDPRFSAFVAALATRDGPIRMQLTHHPGSRSLSADGLYESRRYAEAPGRRLATLMDDLDDRRVDLLKVDIEGAEYRVLPELDLAAHGVRVFAVQLHHNGGVRRARELIAGVRAAGYELVACRPAVKLTFVRSDLL